MKEINLAQLFEAKAFYNNCLYDLDSSQKQCIIDIMREACNDTVDLCLENAEIDKYGCVDEVSILNTKNQIV